MRQMTAFVKKEFLEQVRSGKLIVLAILFCLFGIMNPAVAKLTPWMMELMSEQLAESGMTVTSVEVNALTSWAQFFKNMPIMLIIFIVMFSGILTLEYQKGTLVNVVTKGLARWKILAAKMMVMVVFWTVGCLTTYGITYGYNAYFWDNSIAHNLFFSAFCFYLAGLWLITVILLASTLVGAASAVTLLAGAAYVAAYLLGLIPKMKEYVPTFLMNSNALLTGELGSDKYLIAIAITCFLIVVNVILSVLIFNRKAI